MSRRGKDRPWSAAELDLVRRLYPTEPVGDIAARLPGRTPDGVRHAAKRIGVTTARMWTVGDEEVLRREWGHTTTNELSRRLRRAPSALKQKAVRLGLSADRRYTDAEKDLVRRLYPTHTAAQIAAQIHGSGRSALSIYRLAQELGLRKCPHWSPEEVGRVREEVERGGTDADVALRLGLAREQVTHVRNRLKLPRNADAVREAGRRAVKTQFERLGIKSGGELRALAYRNYARGQGWPEDLPPRAVQILNVLAEHGPKTADELAAAIGMRTDVPRRCMLLRCSAHSRLTGGHGTYAGLLVARGLVFRRRRSAGKGSGRSGQLPALYLLTPAAIATREECLGRRSERDQRSQRAREENLHADPPRPGPGGHPGAGGNRRVGGTTPAGRVRRGQAG